MHHKLMPHRIGALIDGIFAIVMTILVLDIKVPHDPSLLRDISLERFLRGEFQDIILYMTVFILLGHIWVALHNRAHFVKYTNTIHVWLNILFLMFIALLPFTSAMVNKFPEDNMAAFILATNMLIIGIFGGWTWSYATKNRHLVEDSLTDSEIELEKRRSYVLPLVSAMAMAVAAIYPLISSYVLLIAPVAIPLVRRRRQLIPTN